jgi:CDP-diacylglycerol--serine O-phosphatidyltransferase
MFLRYNLPHIFTAANLLCGCLAIALTFNHHFETATWMIIAAALFDFFDGFVARLLRVEGLLGKQLDSLADLVTFGVAPAMLIFNLVNLHPNYFDSWLSVFALVAPFAIPIASAFRLAAFNLSDTSADMFIGLPTPANALYLSSLALICKYNYYGLRPWIMSPSVIVALCAVQSWLLVSNVPLLGFKIKPEKDWTHYRYHLAFAFASLISLVRLGYAAAPLILLFYIGISVIKTAKVAPLEPAAVFSPTTGRRVEVTTTKKKTVVRRIPSAEPQQA